MFHPRLSLVVILLGTGIGTLAQEAPMLYYPHRGHRRRDPAGRVPAHRAIGALTAELRYARKPGGVPGRPAGQSDFLWRQAAHWVPARD